LPTLTSRHVERAQGVVRTPGDKSCSHRALILGGLANGTSRFTGLLEGDDVRRTGEAMAALGVRVVCEGPGIWTIDGVGQGGLSSPKSALDFGNSGTGSRLMMGVLAGYDFAAQMTGDDSLSSRPMRRVITPLTQMGATFETSDGGRLPLTMHGKAPLAPIDFAPPQASAQVKSAILLAGLRADGETRVREAKPTRDHTERMLRRFGVEVEVSRNDAGVRTVGISGGQSLAAVETSIPGDPSSAAFLLAAGLISPKGNVLVESVMSNETRDGFLRVAALMGAELGAEETGDAAGERLIDVQALSSELRGVEVPSELVPAMIDEFPILAVLAAVATGTTTVTGAAELRVKESDRIAAIVAMLRVNGVRVEETEDGFVIEGCGGRVPGGGVVETQHDHRIAMSALVLGTAAKQPVTIDDADMIATSYPEFVDHMRRIGADIH